VRKPEGLLCGAGRAAVVMAAFRPRWSFFERPDFDLAHTPAGDAVFLRQLLQGGGFVLQRRGLQNMRSAIGQVFMADYQQIMTVASPRARPGVSPDRDIVRQPVLPLRFPIPSAAGALSEASPPGQPAVQARSIRLGDAQLVPSGGC